MRKGNGRLVPSRYQCNLILMNAQRRLFNCVEDPGDEIIIHVFSFVSNPLPSPPPSKKSEMATFNQRRSVRKGEGEFRGFKTSS